MAQVKSLNNTLEEELRIMLVELNNENQALKSQIEMLKQTVAEEQEQKYRALVRCADLQKEINKKTD
jgi:hypothetical protein